MQMYTPYASEKDVNCLLEILEKETFTLFEWVKFNEMKPNEDKCHLFLVNPVRNYQLNWAMKPLSTVFQLT